MTPRKFGQFLNELNTFFVVNLYWYFGCSMIKRATLGDISGSFLLNYKHELMGVYLNGIIIRDKKY